VGSSGTALLAILSAFLAPAASAGPTDAVAAKTHVCRAVAKPLAESPTAVIFAAGYGTYVYGCFKPTGQLRYLALTEDLSAVATTGDYVAYSENYGANPDFSGTPATRLENLRTGRTVRQAHQDVGMLFLTAQGVAAWPTPIYCPTATVPRSCGTALYVMDHHGPRQVGQGNIRLNSIRFTGARQPKLVWATPGRTHEARVYA